MRKNTKVYVGDRIVTNKNFKPFMSNKDLFDVEDNKYKGTIIEIRDSMLNIAFDDEHPFCHTLENRTDRMNGYSLLFKESDLDSSVDLSDEKKRAFVGLIRELAFKKISELPIKIRSKEDSLRSLVSTARSLAADLSRKELQIEGDNHKLADLIKSKRGLTVNVDELVSKYDKFMSNKKIASVDPIESDGYKSVLITTNDLVYHREGSSLGDFTLGAYKILIPLDSGQRVRAINYKRHKDRFKYHHPCINNSTLCLGESVGDEVMKLRNEGNIIGLAYLLIIFLEKPDYGNPYIQEEEFFCAQTVTIKPENEIDWFSNIYWDENEKWDGRKFAEDFKNLNTTSAYCENCERSVTINEDGDCPDCGEELSST